MSPLLLGPPLLLATIVAGLVLSAGPQRPDNRAFFAQTVLAVLHNLIAAYVYLDMSARPPVVEAALWALSAVWLFTSVMFAWSFPTARPAPARLWAPLLLATLAVVASAVSGDAQLTQPLFRMFALVTSGLILWFLAGARGRAHSEAPRRGIVLVQLVMLTRLVLGAVIATQGHLRGAGPTPLMVFEITVVPPLTSVVFAYALLHYQLLDIRGFVSRSIGLFAVTAVSGLLLVGGLELLQRLLRSLNLTPWGEGQLVAPGVVILALLAFNPVKMKLEEALEGWVNRGLVRARGAVQVYIGETEGVLDVDHLLRALQVAVAEVLPGASAAVAVSRPEGQLLTTEAFADATGLSAGTRSIPLAAVGPALAYLHQHRQGPWTRLDGEHHEALRALIEQQADAILPFRTGEAGEGALLLRAPRWERERLQLLQQIATHLGLQLGNALLYQRALDANRSLSDANQTLAQMRSFLEAVVAAMPVGLMVLTEGDLIERWNPAMERLTGLEAGGVIGSQGLPAPLESLGSIAELAAAPGAVTHHRLSVARGQERLTRRVNARVAPLSGAAASNRGWVVLLSDVTELLRLQDDLESSRRLAALGQLAAAMAHEIRTPLTSIKLNAQILAGKLELTPNDSEHFDIVLEELDRLNRYVSEVLDYARPLKLSTHEQDLVELVQEVGRSLYFLLAERQVELDISAAPGRGLVAELDAERLKQVIINLLDNASQAYSEEGGRVEVQIRQTYADERRAAGVELLVKDSGSGMDPQTLHHIFEPFFTTRPTGTGLGLAIAERIVASHAGTLTATSAPGEGSTFCLWLPSRSAG